MGLGCQTKRHHSQSQCKVLQTPSQTMGRSTPRLVFRRALHPCHGDFAFGRNGHFVFPAKTPPSWLISGRCCCPHRWGICICQCVFRGSHSKHRSRNADWRIMHGTSQWHHGEPIPSNLAYFWNCRVFVNSHLHGTTLQRLGDNPAHSAGFARSQHDDPFRANR